MTDIWYLGSNTFVEELDAGVSIYVKEGKFVIDQITLSMETAAKLVERLQGIIDSYMPPKEAAP